MSYYYEHKLQFSDHGMHRIKERLKMNVLDDFQLKDECIKLIDNYVYKFESSKAIYFEVPNFKRMFFVVNKINNLIITCTPISVQKELDIVTGRHNGFY